MLSMARKSAGAADSPGGMFGLSTCRPVDLPTGGVWRRAASSAAKFLKGSGGQVESLTIPAGSADTPFQSCLESLLMRRLSICFLFMATPLVHAQASEQWSLGDPDSTIRAVNVLCSEQARATLTAGALRVSGKSRSEVLALVPDSPKSLVMRTASAMRESVEDSFDFPKLSVYAHYSFRSEVCMRETVSAVRMPRLATMQAKVEDCQRVHGSDKSNNLFKCIQAVVRAAEPRM